VCRPHLQLKDHPLRHKEMAHSPPAFLLTHYCTVPSLPAAFDLRLIRAFRLSLRTVVAAASECKAVQDFRNHAAGADKMRLCSLHQCRDGKSDRTLFISQRNGEELVYL
jgi:hypothetical protein